MPDQLEGLETGWEYGTDLNYMRAVIDYWRDSFDWRAAEERINNLGPQYTTVINGLKIHFVHRRSSNPNAKPLIISHGW
jgi:hypothetical protein